MELPHIGQTCVICNRNDYLPFKCNHCDKIVCVDHKTNHGSECPINQLTFQVNLDDQRPTESIKEACDFCRKITLKLELVECQSCNQRHCLYHRHQVQHKCPQLDEIKKARESEEQSRAERRKEALDRLKSTNLKSDSHQQQALPASSQRINTINPKNRPLARRIRLMKMKQTARGPPNILAEDKLYFEVRFAHDPECSLSNQDKNGKTIRFFTTAKHTIGRMVDWSADELGLVNKNHLMNADQLCLLNQCQTNDNLTVLDNEKNFQYYLDSGDLLSGDELTMSYRKN